MPRAATWSTKPALLQALDSGRIAGAALDVGRAPDQMPAPALARHPRVIATPHIGGLTLPAIEHQSMETARQVADIVGGPRAGGRRQCAQHARSIVRPASASSPPED